MIKAGRQIRSAAMIQAFLGFVLLLLAASCIEWYLDTEQHRLRTACVGVGCLLCGATALTSSWFVFRRRHFAAALYAASWSLNLLAWISLGLVSHYRPLWWVLGTSACLALAAVNFSLRVRRALENRSLAS
jgi:hypothetical protein